MEALRIVNQIVHYIDNCHQIIESLPVLPSLERELSSDPVFLRVQSSLIEPKDKSNALVIQTTANTHPIHLSFIVAINLLTEYLPRSAIGIIFGYCADCIKLEPPFCVNDYLQNGWESKHDVLHDIPDIYVENVLPIINQPSLILTIGVPGSGKTTWAVNIRCSNPEPNNNNNNNSNVIAADDYFTIFNDGEFDVQLLAKAHKWCQSEIFSRLQNGNQSTTCVVVNNTNTTLWEMNVYVRYVILLELKFKIVFAHMTESNVRVLQKRGLHGVKAKKIKQMLYRIAFWRRRGPPTIQRALKKLKPKYPPKGASREVFLVGIYFGAEIRQQIQDYFVDISGCQLLQKQTDCHLTLHFQPTVEQLSQYPFGQSVKVRLIGYAKHAYLQCILIDILDDNIEKLVVDHKYPHITLSFNGQYLSPVNSNFLLEYGRIWPFIKHFDFADTEYYNRQCRTNDGLMVEGTVAYMQHRTKEIKYLLCPEPTEKQAQQRLKLKQIQKLNVCASNGNDAHDNNGNNNCDTSSSSSSSSSDSGSDDDESGDSSGKTNTRKKRQSKRKGNKAKAKQKQQYIKQQKKKKKTKNIQNQAVINNKPNKKRRHRHRNRKRKRNAQAPQQLRQRQQTEESLRLNLSPSDSEPQLLTKTKETQKKTNDNNSDSDIVPSHLDTDFSVEKDETDNNNNNSNNHSSGVDEIIEIEKHLVTTKRKVMDLDNNTVVAIAALMEGNELSPPPIKFQKMNDETIAKTPIHPQSENVG